MNIQKHTEDFINELLWFKLGYDVSKYLSDKASLNWREFEAEQHEEYPIKGCGLVANASLLNQWTLDNESLLHLEEDLAPEDTGSETESFPRDTVSIIYAFSLLESYGNAVCDKLNPGYRRVRQAWHHGVYGDADLNDPVKKQKMKENFCKPFDFDISNVSDQIASALVVLKHERNSIVHELSHSHDFEFYFRCVMAVTCCIYFCWSGSKSDIKLYPWYDYDGKFKL